MAGGVSLNNGAPSVTKTERENNFGIVDTLCQRFTGLSPFEVMHADLTDVMALYTDTVINDSNEKKGNTQDVWVTSANATWH